MVIAESIPKGKPVECEGNHTFRKYCVFLIYLMALSLIHLKAWNRWEIVNDEM
jgi:hypothetical protein